MPTAPPAYRISRHAVQEGLDAYSYNDSKVVSGLISELALYFLIYTESANMRFAPELLWFIYWCMSHSFVMMELWQREMPEGEEPSRDRRVELRNRFQVGGGVGGRRWGQVGGGVGTGGIGVRTGGRVVGRKREGEEEVQGGGTGGRGQLGGGGTMMGGAQYWWGVLQSCRGGGMARLKSIVAFNHGTMVRDIRQM